MTGWRTALEVMAEIAVLVALFVAVPTLLYLLAWSQDIPR